MKILITGGAGYIGAHTIVELFEMGYTELFSVDNFINSDGSNYDGIEEICGKRPKTFQLDLCDHKAVEELFNHYSFDAVIHFAALKSVPESVDLPHLYYRNNLNSLLNVLEQMKKKKVKQLIFSSSCSIYGNPETLPVTESTPFGETESPYARTKQMGESIIRDFTHAHPEIKAISLRYFNPVGVHPSLKIGEKFNERPSNLVPIITQSAAGIRKQMTVFGDDYPTRDGSCIRDYIHVSDIADAHIQALEYLKKEGNQNSYREINLGSGTGTSVLEMIHAFEELSEQKVPYVIGKRRAGDVATIFADNQLAGQLLNWKAKYNLKEMLSTAWQWQKKILNDGTSHL